MKPDTRAFYLDAVTRVLRQLVAQLDDSADLAALARLAQLSPFHFHRIFRGMVGETALELLRRLRLERAAHMLRHSDLPVTQIAFTAGYETHEAFTRAFRAVFGEAPSGFRQNPRARPHLAAPCGIHFDTTDIVGGFIPRNTGGTSMEITQQQLPTLRLATVLHQGPFNQIGAAFEQLGALAGRAGLVAHPGAMMIALVLALFPQGEHTAQVFMHFSHDASSNAQTLAYAFAAAVEVAVLLFVLAGHKGISYTFAAASFATNMVYYAIGGVALLSVAILPDSFSN